jgi:fumarylpyruvate hydrolase
MHRREAEDRLLVERLSGRHSGEFMTQQKPAGSGAALPFEPGPRASLAVSGTEQRFLVRRIYCVGQNYRAHALEMGANPDREPPFFFMKPADAVRDDGSVIAYPPATHDLHHEVELVVAVGRAGAGIAAGTALGYVFGYAVGLDLTRRDLQAAARRVGRPWETSKAFDGSAPIGALLPAAGRAMPAESAIRLRVQGELRQEATLAQMIWPVPEILAQLSTLFELVPGDLVFTGTPAGVGPLAVGDRLEAHIDGLPPLTVRIGPPAAGTTTA